MEAGRPTQIMDLVDRIADCLWVMMVDQLAEVRAAYLARHSGVRTSGGLCALPAMSVGGAAVYFSMCE